MRRYTKTVALIMILAVFASLLAGCGAKKEYTVTFDLNGGVLESGALVQTVREGESATPPEVSFGRKELTWDGDWQNVTEDRTVTAQWKKVAMESADLAEYVQDRTVTVNVTCFDGSTHRPSGLYSPPYRCGVNWRWIQMYPFP